VSVEEQLRREAAGRPLAIAGAVVGALLQLGGSIWREVAFRHAPSGKHKEARSLLFVHDHASALIGSSIVVGVGALALILALRYLYDATKFRRAELPPVALYCAIAGPVIFLAAQIATSTVIASKASDFSHLAHQTNSAAKHITDTGGLKVATGAGLAGPLALGFAFVLISLNAMRVGLLTRFMGILGIIVGVLFVIPIGSPVPVVQAFWLIALAVLFAGRWPAGQPVAWASGRAEPWPSPQEMRERAASNGQGEAAPGSPEEEPPPGEPVAAAETGGGRQRQRSRKRKRKKRR
jgi:hypothetical protein